MDERSAKELWASWAGIGPGSLVFDIGAHEGKHAAVFASLGARVIAVEPQPGKRREIPGVAWLGAAVSDKDDCAQLIIDPEHDYLATIQHDYPERVRRHSDDYFPHGRRERSYVLTYTLDTLIARFGAPDFCKIDVEGHEASVISGLSRPVRALSFEVHDFDLETGKAEQVIAHLDELGCYTYSYSRRESFQIEPIEGFYAEPDVFGDIYAVLIDPL